MTDEQKGAFDDLLGEARKAENKRVPRYEGDDEHHNGPVRELQPWHWQIIRLHLAGYRSRDIASEVGCGDRTVWRTVQHPEAKRLKRELQEATEEHLHSLFPKAVETVDAVMSETDPKLRLHAVDRWVSLVRQRSPEAPSVQVNVNNGVQVSAREKLASALANLADGDGEVIDADGDEGDGCKW